MEAFRALSGRRNRYRHLTKLSWMTYVRSSSDLAQPFGLSSQTCHCLDVRISRSGAGPLGGDCFPRLAAMYLAEAKPPVVWRPAFEVIAGRTMCERTDLKCNKVTAWCGERDLNPQETASETGASAVPPPPLKIGRKGETTPFITGLCSDYARLLIGFPALSTPRLAPGEYPARLPFYGSGITSLLILLSTSSDSSTLTRS